MSSEILKLFYSEGNEYEIINILKLCFDEWKNYKDPLNYWKWKYIDAPNGSTIIVAKQNEKIVAVSHRIYPEIKVGNSILISGYGDDFATHPDFRVKGLFKELQNLSEEDALKKCCNVIVSVNSNPITIKNNLKRGRLLLPSKIEHVVLLNNSSLHFKKMNVKYGGVYSVIFNVLKLCNKFSNLLNSLGNWNNNSYTIKKIMNFDDKYNVFWDKIKGDYNFIGVKNTSFLNWRYSDKRGGNYVIYEIADGDTVLGFMVLEIRDNNGYKSGYILEFLSLKNRDDILINFVQNLKKEMFNLDVNILNFKTTSKKMIKLLEKLGFIRMPFIKEFNAMFTFINSDVEKQIFLMNQSDDIYFGYGNYF